MNNLATITLENICKSFAHQNGMTPVLQAANAIFTQGKSYAITGPSGSGKSTVLHMISGIERPSAGLIAFNGANVHNFHQEELSHFLLFDIGLVFQNPHLIEELTILENVILPGLLGGMHNQAAAKHASDLLALVGLDDKLDHHPSQLSGGQQQRAALARALCNKPAFLLADEPTGNLDSQTADQMMKLINDCQKEWNMGIIMSTHDRQLADKLDVHYQITEKSITQKK